jgi:hypothetical protein
MNTKNLIIFVVIILALLFLYSKQEDFLGNISGINVNDYQNVSELNADINGQITVSNLNVTDRANLNNANLNTLNIKDTLNLNNVNVSNMANLNNLGVKNNTSVNNLDVSGKLNYKKIKVFPVSVTTSSNGQWHQIIDLSNNTYNANDWTCVISGFQLYTANNSAPLSGNFIAHTVIDQKTNTWYIQSSTIGGFTGLYVILAIPNELVSSVSGLSYAINQ